MMSFNLSIVQAQMRIKARISQYGASAFWGKIRGWKARLLALSWRHLQESLIGEKLDESENTSIGTNQEKDTHYVKRSLEYTSDNTYHKYNNWWLHQGNTLF